MELSFTLRLKLLVVLFVQAFACFGLILVALRIKSELLLIVGMVGCAAAILLGIATVLISIILALKSPP